MSWSLSFPLCISLSPFHHVGPYVPSLVLELGEELVCSVSEPLQDHLLSPVLPFSCWFCLRCRKDPEGTWAVWWEELEALNDWMECSPQSWPTLGFIYFLHWHFRAWW
jgi:hypothetical protein